MTGGTREGSTVLALDVGAWVSALTDGAFVDTLPAIVGRLLSPLPDEAAADGTYVVKEVGGSAGDKEGAVDESGAAEGSCS